MNTVFPNTAEPCGYPGCKGIKLPYNAIWRCSIGGLYHHFWLRTQVLKELQKKHHTMPMKDISNPAARYWEHLRRNVKRDGIKEVAYQVLL